MPQLNPADKLGLCLLTDLVELSIGVNRRVGVEKVDTNLLIFRMKSVWQFEMFRSIV